MKATHTPGLIHRVAELDREVLSFTLDGLPAKALAGDSLLTAILTQRGQLRRNEFSGEARAGFCLMGACQDCWVMTRSGERLRACSTPLAAGMDLLSGEGA